MPDIELVSIAGLGQTLNALDAERQLSEAQRVAAQATLANLGGIRAIVVEDGSVTLADTVPGNLTTSSFVTPGGNTIGTVKVNVPVAGSVDVLRADAVSGLLGELADTRADLEQSAANAAALFGATPVPNQAAIPSTPGLYFPQDVASAGMIYERKAGGALDPRPDLKALSATQLAASALGTDKTLADLTAAGGLQTKFAGRIRDYGAVPNDPTKAAMNTAAIIAALVVWEGKTLIFDGDLSGGLSTYYVTRGFNVGDYTRIRGEGRVLLKLADGLPARTDEKTQTAIFTGKNAWTNTTSAGTYGVTIEDIELDTNQPGSPNAMLGGIKLLGAQGCAVRRVTVTVTPILTLAARFGIQISTYDNTPDARQNVVEKCRVILTPNWYTAPGEINQIGLTGIALSSVSGGDGGRQGMHLSDVRTPANGYIPSRTYDNTIADNTVTGGSHGIILTNVRENKITRNRCEDNSHRGIIVTPTCDDNLIEGNTTVDSGSTGIHLAYNCTGNRVINNTVIRVRAEAEGDGIKGYVYCHGNTFAGNVVIDAGRNGVRVAHGSNRNSILNNKVRWTKGRGTGGSAEEAAWQLTVGVKVLGYSQPQWAAGLTQATMRKANSNIVQGNTVDGCYIGFDVASDDPISTDGQVSNNTLDGNLATNCAVGYGYTPRGTAIRSNSLRNNTGVLNDADYASGIEAAHSLIVGNGGNILDKRPFVAPQVILPRAPGTIPIVSDLNSSDVYANKFGSGLTYTPINGGSNLPGGGTQGILTTFIDPSYGADGLGFSYQIFTARGATGKAYIRMGTAVANSAWGAWQRVGYTAQTAPTALTTTAMTVSATPTQAEVQAIATRANEAAAGVNALRTLLIAAGVLA